MYIYIYIAYLYIYMYMCIYLYFSPRFAFVVFLALCGDLINLVRRDLTTRRIP